MNLFQYHNPTMLVFGKGKTRDIGRLSADLGKHVLLVYGGGSIHRNGVYEQVTTSLQKAGKSIVELGGVEPNPRVSTVRKGVALIREHHIDWVLAVGGGSVVDCAKAIAVAARMEEDPWELVMGRAKPTSALPLGVVLTLAATGSEMNPYSVITNWETNQKVGWGSPLAYPRFSILDPLNTVSVPVDHTVNGIVDIMSHVFESYFHHQDHTPLTDGFCETILRSVIKYAPVVLENPADEDARAVILHAGTMALNGLLSMGASGDWATHNLEHAVSAIYDIPHGAGLAILFPVWMRYAVERGVNCKKFTQLGMNVFGLDPANYADEKAFALAAIHAVEQCWQSLGAPSRLAEYQITLDEHILNQLADRTLFRGPFGHFQKLYREDVIAIYRQAQ